MSNMQVGTWTPFQNSITWPLEVWTTTPDGGLYAYRSAVLGTQGRTIKDVGLGMSTTTFESYIVFNKANAGAALC
jgi:hypothetical protein